MPRSSLLPLTLVLALVAGGCDRQSDADTQPAPASSPKSTSGGGEEELTGTLDRSHAGEAMPAVTLTDPAGKTLALASLKGQPVLLNLWATWCAPCVLEMPMLDGLAGTYEGKLRVITASQDMKGAELVAPFFAARKFARLEPWLDSKNELGFQYGGGLPATVLFDAQGKEVWRMAGGYDWSSPAAQALVDEAL